MSRNTAEDNKPLSNLVNDSTGFEPILMCFYMVLRTGFEPVTSPWKGDDLNRLSNGVYNI